MKRKRRNTMTTDSYKRADLTTHLQTQTRLYINRKNFQTPHTLATKNLLFKNKTAKYYFNAFV